jgi:hypothetical protein
MGECLVVNDIDSQFYQYHQPAAEGEAAKSDPEQTQPMALCTALPLHTRLAQSKPVCM